MTELLQFLIDRVTDRVLDAAKEYTEQLKENQRQLYLSINEAPIPLLKRLRPEVIKYFTSIQYNCPCVTDLLLVAQKQEGDILTSLVVLSDEGTTCKLRSFLLGNKFILTRLESFRSDINLKNLEVKIENSVNYIM